jgi:hypothetical protein
VSNGSDFQGRPLTAEFAGSRKADPTRPVLLNLG